MPDLTSFLFCSKAIREGRRARKWQRVSGTQERVAELQCHAGGGGGGGEWGGMGGWAAARTESSPSERVQSQP